MTTPLDLAAIRERHEAGMAVISMPALCYRLPITSMSALQCHTDRGALLAVAEAAAALLDALPQCDDCGAIATLECRTYRYCDAHRPEPAPHGVVDVWHAAELRALAAALDKSP